MRVPKFLQPEVIPFVDVEIIPAKPEDRGPVVDVRIVPKGEAPVTEVERVIEEAERKP